MTPNQNPYTTRLQANHVRDAHLFPPETDIPEIELQARWFGGQFGRDFTTTDGRRVRIVQFGEWNHAAGPDFINASVRFDDNPPERGSIELDRHASDWEAHGHASNPDYGQTVLHAFFHPPRNAFFTRTVSHREVPQIKLSVDAIDNDHPPLTPSARPGRCSRQLAAMPREQAVAALHEAALHRLAIKASRLARSIEAHGIDHAVYHAIAEALGYAGNKLPFLLLAQRTPLTTKDAEAVLFGLSGFLEPSVPGHPDAKTAPYVRDLWAAWWKYRVRMSHLVLPRDSWKLSGARPFNHPQRRLGALAALAGRWHAFRQTLDSDDLDATSRFLSDIAHPFWSYRYTLRSHPTSRPRALIGRTRLDAICTNILYPLLLTRGRRIEEAYLKHPAPQRDRDTRTAAIRLFQNERPVSIHPATTGIQQGLLQIYHDYCQQDATDCLQCPFPETLEATPCPQTAHPSP